MDEIDVAQRRQQDEIDHALANRGVVKVGLLHCETAYCCEPISELRRNMGARQCVDCADRSEREARRWAPRGQG